MKWSKAMLVEGKDTLLGVKNTSVFFSQVIRIFNSRLFFEFLVQKQKN